MSNFRKVNDDILREWLNYREETEFGYLTKEDFWWNFWKDFK